MILSNSREMERSNNSNYSDEYIESTLLKPEPRPFDVTMYSGEGNSVELGKICPLHTFFSKHLLYPVGYRAIHVLNEPYPLTLTCRLKKEISRNLCLLLSGMV